MSQINQSWNSRPPFMPLSALPLVIAASSRLSNAVTALFLLVAMYVLSLAIVHGGKSIIPAKYHTAIVIMIVTFVTSLLYLVIDMINPVSARELYLVVFLIPVTFLSSHFGEKAGNLSVREEIIAGAKHAAILGGIIVVIALIREPLGYGTLSLPFSGKAMHLLPESIEDQAVLQVFSAPLGGFLMSACAVVLTNFISHEQNQGAQREQFDD